MIEHSIRPVSPLLAIAPDPPLTPRTIGWTVGLLALAVLIAALIGPPKK